MNGGILTATSLLVLLAQGANGDTVALLGGQLIDGAASRAKAGVRVGVGSDFGGYDAHLNAREFGALVEAGMSPMQAIQAGTRVNAELLGMETELGTIEPGKLADIIAVGGDPLVDISELERVIFVMKDGRVVKRP